MITTFEISVEDMSAEAAEAFREAVREYLLFRFDAGFVITSKTQTDAEAEAENAALVAEGGE